MAGVVFAVVGIELMPEALAAEPAWLIIPAFVAGGGFFMLVERLLGARGDSLGGAPENARPCAMYSGAADLFSDGVMISSDSTLDLGLGFLLALGQVPADVPEGSATTAAFQRQGVLRRHRLLLATLAVPILVGVTVGYLAVGGQPEIVKMSLLALAAGILTTVVVEEIVPEAHAGEEARLAAMALLGPAMTPHVPICMPVQIWYTMSCMALTRSPAQVTASYEFFVENMDCADCARTVEGALGHVNGVSDVKVNFTTQKLRLTLDEALVSRATVERNLTTLGYPPRAQTNSVPTEEQGQASSSASSPAWYRTSKGRTVLVTGALLIVSVLLALVFPPLAPWGFTAATLIGVAPLARKAWASTRLGQPFTINTLIALAALGAVAIGEAAEGAIVVFLFAIGELLENVATGRARAGIRALAALAPKVALLLDDGKAREVPVGALRPGDLVRVQPGGRVPADGTIVEGTAGVDDSPVTGESMPAYKGEGDGLFAGSISTDAVLIVRVDKSASDSTIARIIHLVEEAERSKAPVARFIDRFSRVYTPGAMLVATLVAVVPPLLFGASWEAWVYRALALLLIACPCALVLSVPAAVTSGISAGARRGLLIKGGAVLESIGDVKTVAFDKTGTLTENRPRVTDVVPLSASEAEVLRLAAAVETGSAHPLARAILERAQGLDVPLVQDARALAGQAVTATLEGRNYAVGSPRYAADLAPLPAELEERIAALEDQGKTVVLLLEGATPLGLMAIRDEPRADAAEAVKRLSRLGVHSVMLTGDNARTGEAVAGALGLEVRSELLPEAKLAAIDQLKQRGKVAMVGDGINDAPALARADVGIAMGGGTDVALETAGAALLRENATGVSDLIELSRATMRNIRQNVAFSLGLKAIFLVTTLLGITGLWPAILSDTGATVVVTANALRLLRFEPSQGHAA